jgi:indole-3-acetate monooxygenase
LACQIVSRLWDQAQAGQMPPPDQQAKVRAAASYITEVSEGVTRVAFQAAGGSALFDTNPLQRCLRDIYAVGQHFLVSRSSYRALGQFRLRQPDANPML